MTEPRTAKSLSEFLDTPRTRLVHSVMPYRAEWRSLCGYNFLSYETRREPRVVTCVWCIAELLRQVPLGSF